MINKTIPVTLNGNLLTFRDTDKKFELIGDLLQMITERNYNFDFANLPDKTFMSEFTEETYFDEKALFIKITTDRTLIRLLKSPAITASGVAPRSPKESKTRWLSSDPRYDFCDR